MKEFQKPKQKRNLFHTTPAIIILVLFLLFFIYNIFGLIRKNSETKENKVRAQIENAKLLDQQAHLDADMKELETERGTEQVIREKFGVVKKGEGVVVVVDENPEVKGASIEKEKGIGGFFKRLFGKDEAVQ